MIARRRSRRTGENRAKHRTTSRLKSLTLTVKWKFHFNVQNFKVLSIQKVKAIQIALKSQHHQASESKMHQRDWRFHLRHSRSTFSCISTASNSVRMNWTEPTASTASIKTSYSQASRSSFNGQLQWTASTGSPKRGAPVPNEQLQWSPMRLPSSCTWSSGLINHFHYSAAVSRSLIETRIQEISGWSIFVHLHRRFFRTFWIRTFSFSFPWFHLFYSSF